MIYSCFAGIGKTTLAERDGNFVDLESSDYQWIYPDSVTEDKESRKGIEEREKNPLFPMNYVDDMERHLNEEKKVLISSQPEVLREVVNRGLPFMTVTPNKALKEEYIERYKVRGNNESFVELMDKNFDNFSEDLSTNEDAVANIIIRKNNTYLSDIL